MKSIFFILITAFIFSVNVNANSRVNEPIKPIPLTVKSNKAKVELGKKLFFEPRLSKSGFISCNSCHNLSTGGADNLPSSIGHKWQLGPINSPTVLNAKFNLAQFWDGRAKDLKEQAGGPIANPGEMASSHKAVISVLKSMPEYEEMFLKVYGTNKVTQDRITGAIAAFEETLTTPNSKFDRWLRGDDKVLTSNEEQGYQLFKSKGCITCHNGIGVGGGSFQKFGVVKPYRKDMANLGRFSQTKKESDKFVFKVPLLRNIELTAPYFHDGSTWDLNEAVDIMAEFQLGVKLSRNENKNIVAFLKTLTGEQPKIIYPILPPSRKNTPKPDRLAN
ncbi:MAG: cytochrome-c peroxidase [Thiohalomonadales bacterium]